MKIKFIPMHWKLLLSLIVLGFFFSSCSTDKTQDKDIVITISVKGDVVVNADTVAVDSLKDKLRELGANQNTNIRIVPSPEAGAATIEKVQQIVGAFKNSDSE